MTTMELELLNQILADTVMLRDMLVGDVLRTNEMQAWFLSEHLVDVPLAPVASTSG